MVTKYLSDQGISQLYILHSKTEQRITIDILEFCLRSVKPYLPNAQWNQNAIQSLQHMTKLDQRVGSLDEALRILTAYREQAIGQDLRRFSQQQRRKIRIIKHIQVLKQVRFILSPSSKHPISHHHLGSQYILLTKIAIVAATTLFALHVPDLCRHHIFYPTLQMTHRTLAAHSQCNIQD